MDMCNCLKYKKILFKSDQKTGGSIFHALFHTLKKTLTFSFLFIIFISAVQAETYYWVGGTSGDWDTGTNWNTMADGSGTSGVPGSGDNVYIQSSASISIGTNDISVDGISLGSNNQSESFSVTISGTGTLTVGNYTFPENSADSGIVTYRPTNTSDTTKTTSLILDCNVSASNLAIHSGGNVSISSGKTVTIPTITIMAISDLTPTELNVEGTLISSTSITIADFSNQTISVGSSGIISASSISASNGTITNDGLIITQPPIITSALNTASTGITTTASAGSFIWTGASDTDWNTAGNWLGGIIPSSSSIITIPAVTNQPVIASGDSVTIDDVSNLIIDSGSSITVDGTLELTGDFTIDSKITEASSGNLIISGTLTNTEVFTSSTLNLECSNISAGDDLEFKNITLATGASISGDASITCEDITFNGSASVGSDIALVHNGDLSASGNVTFAGNYTNNGNANFANGLTLAGNFTDSGTSFSGTITLNGSSDQSFAGKAASSSYEVVVNKSTGDLEFTNDLTLTSLDTYTNNYTGTVTFSGTGTQTLTPQTQVYQSITVNKSSGSLLVNGDLQAKTLSVTSGEILLAGNLTLTDGSSFQNVDFSSSSGKITFTGGTSSTPRILKAGNITLSDEIYTSNSTDYLKLEASDIELNSCTNIANLILETSGNISINGIETGTLSLSSSASSITMGGSIKLTDNSQDLIIDYPLVLFADTSFDIAGNIIIMDSASPARVGSINSDSTARALTLKAGSGKSIQIQNGNSSGAGLGTTTSLSTIKINSDIVISADTEFKTSGTSGTTFAGSGNSISGSYILSFTGNFTNSDNWTYDNGLTLNFIGTNNQTITTNSTSTYPTIIENKDSGTLKIIGNCTINNFELTKGTTTTFTGSPIITSFTDTASSGNLNFNEGGTITATGGQTFLTTGQVSFGDAQSDTMTFGTSPSYSNLTHTAGPTSLTGNLYAGVTSLGTLSANGSIVTSGAQNFNGPVTLADDLSLNAGSANTITFDSTATIDGAYSLTIDTANNTIFNADVGASTNLSSISSTSPITFNCEKITTSGTQDYSAAITLSSSPISHTFTGSQITFDTNASVDGASDLILKGSTNFKANVGASTNLSSISSTSPISINCASITTSGNQTYSDNVTASYTGSFMTSTNGSLSFAKTFSVNNDIDLSAIGTGGGISFSSTSNITGSAKLTALAGTNNINFAGNVGTSSSFLGELKISTSGTSSFSNPVYITIFTDTASSGNLIFNDGGTITATGGQTFLTTGQVSFGDAQSDTMTFGTSPSYSNLTHTAGPTSLTGNLYAGVTSLGTLSANGSIVTSGAQNFNGPVTLAGDLSLNAGSANTITFDSTATIDGAYSLTIDTANNTIFNANVGASTNLSSISSTSPVSINCASITTSGNQTYSDNVTASYTGSFMTSTNGSLSFAKTFSVNNDIDLSAIGTGGGISFSSTSNITGSAKLSALAGTNNINFAGNVGTSSSFLGELKISTSGTSSFSNPVYITKFTDTASSGNLIFNDGGTITATGGQTFLTTGQVSIGDAQSDTMTFGTSSSYSNLTHTAGSTNLAGTINANNITLSSSELNNAANVNCSKITLQDNLSYKNDSYYLKVTGNLNTKNSISIGQNVMLDGNFTSEDGVPVFEKNLYIFKGTNTASSVTINSLSLTGDLIINAERAINTTDTITVGNFVLYRGQITAAANSIIHTTKDVVLFGPQYSPTDPTRLSDTSNTAYSYQQTRTSCPCNYTESATMPDGTSIPTPSDGYTGLYDAGAGASFYVGKNWYANGLMDSTSSPTRGLTSSTSGQWYIDLPNLIDTQNQTGFAETYNSYVTYSTVRCHAYNPYDESGDYAKMPAYNCQYPANAVSGEPENDVNWIFEAFSITKAYTVRDNVICLFFNHSVRNSSAELKNAVSRFVNSADSFAGFYTDADCINELGNNTNLTPDSSGNVYIYIKASNSTTWNTDATGTDAGSDSSTNRNGIHQTVIPFIKISENGNLPITDIWGKRLAYYDNEDKFTDISDHTGPVLYSVRTGQELHTPYSASTGENSQPSYDAHNFLEFRYSEKVNFGSISAAATDVTANVFDNSNTSADLWLPAAASTTADQTVNVRVHDSFGALTHDVTQSGNLTLAGLAKIATGKLYTAREGIPSKYVNSLYRPDAYSIRLSIAGYTEGSASDQANNSYKKWIGYIENAVQPAGLVTMISNSNSMVTDCALDLDGSTPLYNAQEEYTNPVTPSVNVNYSNGSDYTYSGVYSDWDLSEPVFAPLRLDSNASWGLGDYYEAVGTNSGSGSTLDKIEFHFFDNTPYYSDQDEAAWLSEKGWVTNESGSNTLYDADYTYCADIIGGARQFDPNASQRTTGGLRFSTKENCSAAFKYSTSQASSAVTDKSFASGSSSLNIGAKASLFVGSSTTRRSATDPDGLYFGLGLIDTSYPVSQSFTVSYNDADAYITDLAGNRLRTSTIKTIDRTPPSYDITISPINQKELKIVFVKKLVVDSEKIKYRDNSGNQIEVDEDFVNLIPKCFELVTISDAGIASKSEGLQIDYTIPAKFEHIISQTNESTFTVLTLTLTQNTTLKDLENLYLRLIYADGYNEYSQDPITSINDSRVTFIQDEFGNYMQMYEAHAISDFAINVINPLYAYDAEMTYNDEVIMDGLYTQGSWAVTDWNADQQNYGSLPANHAWDIVAQIDDGNQKLENIPAGTRIFMAQTQTENSVSSQYNQDLNQNLRIWLPNVTNSIIAALAPVNNDLSNISQIDSTFLDDGSSGKIDFSISSEITSIWGANKQITFLFSLLDSKGQLIRIYNSPYFNVTSNSYDFSLSTAIPLFAIRLKDNSDITSLDLWSVKTKSITDQRGGVTILNNVINATNGEKVVVKIDNPSNGKLNVIVMTIDGNIISYLNRASTAAGTYYYSWDGKNKSGNKVARGMYFIRVVGNGIDETRKVMVVK